MGGYRNTFVRRLARTAAAALLCGVCAVAFADGDVAGGDPLREAYDPDLQYGLEAALERLALDDDAAREKLCIALVDITDLHHPRVAEVNGDHMMYAASLPKIAILLGAFVEIERGHLSLSQANVESMTRMIRVSSNTDATRMLNLVGKRRVNRILQSERFRLYDPVVNGGLWVGKEYAQGAAFERDPLHNLSHGATAMQTARFYYLLEAGELVNPKLTRVMKSMLSEPGIKHKFVKGLDGIPGLRIYRKSGTWQHWHADSALVEGQGRKYILVGLADDTRGGEWLAALAPELHKLVNPTRLASARAR
ncbi:MAG: serine hydrolase [Gammaproteobacteria bacterium]